MEYEKALDELLAKGISNEEIEEQKVAAAAIDGHEADEGGAMQPAPEESDEISDGSEGSAAEGGESEYGEGVYTETAGEEDESAVKEVEGMVELATEAEYVEGFMETNELFERVHGSDDRRRVSPTTGFPWRTICKLEITAANGRRFGCSGAMIGPRTVLTNGHCVYLHDHGGWARTIRVTPGMNGSSRPYGYVDCSFYHSVKGWTRSRSSNYDYAVIVLPSNNKLGNRVGWMGLASLSWTSLMGLRVNNSGYPGDKPFGTQWWNANNVLAVTSRRVYYRLDTYGGQSGSPVWRYRNNQRHIVAVHNTGGAVFNGSVRLVKPVFNNLVNWKNRYR
jgi:V8-like Glu-specific endopeptidase